MRSTLELNIWRSKDESNFPSLLNVRATHLLSISKFSSRTLNKNCPQTSRPSQLVWTNWRKLTKIETFSRGRATAQFESSKLIRSTGRSIDRDKTIVYDALNRAEINLPTGPETCLRPGKAAEAICASLAPRGNDNYLGICVWNDYEDIISAGVWRDVRSGRDEIRFLITFRRASGLTGFNNVRFRAQLAPALQLFLSFSARFVVF